MNFTELQFEYHKSKKEHLTVYLIMLSVGWVLNFLLISLIILVIYTLIMYLDKRTSYNGYKLEDNYFTIYSESLVHSFNKKLKLSDIDKITYYYTTSGGGSGIKYSIKGKEYISDTFDSIFSFAKVLKYLKYEKGMNVICGGEIDAEIKLYLDDKIDDIPMRNK